jgi:LuxR family maltose regulon positive regulatory protein
MLVAAANDAAPILVGTPAWFAWLEDATAFAFSSPSGSFTAHKERRTRGGWYWKAYRTVNGTLQRAYLGKGENLTLVRLERAAMKLASASTPAEPLPVAPPAAPAAAMPLNVLATKLFVPSARAKLVPRQRLFDRPPAWVTGQADAHLSARRLRQDDAGQRMGCRVRATGCLAVAGRGGERPRALSDVPCCRLQTIAPTIGAGLVGVLQAPQPPPAEAILTALLNDSARSPTRFVLVLDDYHVIDARPVDDCAHLSA